MILHLKLFLCQPDVIRYSSHSSLMGIIELTLYVYWTQYSTSNQPVTTVKARISATLAELDHLNVTACYRTVEVSVLGHSQSNSIKDVTHKVLLSKANSVRSLLSGAPLFLHSRYSLIGDLWSGLSAQTAF